MNKRKNCILLTFLLIVSFSFITSAADKKLYEEQLEASGADKLFDELPEETVELLEELGITQLDFDSMFTADLRQVAGLFYKVIRNEYSSAFSHFPLLAASVIIFAAFSALTGDDGKYYRLMRIVTCSVIALAIIGPLSGCITRAITSLRATSSFMLLLVPVLAAVITACGKPSLALSYNSVSVAAAQIFSSFSADFIRPLVQMITSMGIVSGITQMQYLSRLTDFVKKSVVFLLSFSATLFITMLTLKGALSVSVDNAAVRGIRFVIGNMIPVIGGAVSDAYTSVIGTLSLVKNTVAVFGLAAVALINLPVLAECVIWVFMLSVVGVIADVFGSGEVSALLKGISSGVTLLAVIMLFEMLLFLLSTGLIILVWSE